MATTLRRQNALSEFFAGTGLLLRGLGLVARGPRLLLLGLVDRASDPGTSTAGPARRRSTANVLIRPLVVILAVVVLVLAGVGAFKASVQGFELARDPSQAAGLGLARYRIEMLRAEFVAQVPTGSRMYIDPSVVWGEWGQRLGEFAAMNGVFIVADVGQADYHVSVVGAPDAPGGLRLTVEKLG